MAQVAYRANLSASFIPLLTRHQGRSIIVPGPDNTFNRSVVSREDPDRDVGIPQIYYAHNVVPTAFGFQSVGYLTAWGGIPGETFSRIYLIRDQNENRLYFTRTAAGHNYICRQAEGVWVHINDDGGNGTITTAHTNGQTYIYFANSGCYVWDETIDQIVSVTLDGLVAADILGICTAAGYLLAYDEFTIYHSSTIPPAVFTDPVDFVPDEITGAGSDSLEQARGAIVTVLTAPFGFIAYTTANAVAGVFSNNADFPFNFRAVPSGGGVASAEDVTYDADSLRHYAWTTSGLQSLHPNGAETIYAQVTDFVGGKIFEDLDETTFTLSEIELTVPMVHKITLVADRYLIVSYGATSLTHAIVIDTVERRYGKLRVSHVDCFEHLNVITPTDESPRKSIAFMQEDGEVLLADMTTESGSTGAAIFGKYQYARSRMITLDTVDIEGVSDSSDFSVKNLYTLDGLNTAQANLSLLAGIGKLRRYGSDTTGMNHSLCLVGAFALSSLSMKFHTHGRE